jgi:serralysin
MLGNNGDDTINGNRGNDALSGGSGNDVLRGGSGDDTLHGERGVDQLYGGAGADVFRFGNRGIYDTDVDQIFDFEKGETIDLDLVRASNLFVISRDEQIEVEVRDGSTFVRAAPGSDEFRDIVELVGVQVDKSDIGFIF